MAVYTELKKEDIEAILKAYQIGSLLTFEAVSSGIENTNYFLWTSNSSESEKATSEWVLTIFENLQEEDIPFFNELTAFLHKQGFFTPAPVINKQGEDMFTILHENMPKFGLIVPRFKGESLASPDEADCFTISKYMARMHLALQDFPLEQEVEHSINWCHVLIEKLKPKLPQEDSDLLEVAMKRYLDYQQDMLHCPSGIVHGDMFRDNVLFENKAISGVIDFYHAGKTTLLFDLAVLANDWAVNFEFLPALFSQDEHAVKPDRESYVGLLYHEKKLSTLVDAYESVRPFTALEKKLWPKFLELAAFRFWLSRLKTKYLEGYQQDVKEGDVVKCPSAMKLILLAAMKRH